MEFTCIILYARVLFCYLHPKYNVLFIRSGAMSQKYEENASFNLEEVEEGQSSGTVETGGGSENFSGLVTSPCAGEEELHVYVDGNRKDSGDGLTPAGAFATCAEAFDLLTFCSGYNYTAVMHFASLENGKEYPPVCLSKDKTAGFRRIRLEGESHEKTMLSLVEACGESEIEVRKFSLRFAHAHHHGRIVLSQAVGLRPNVCTGSLGSSFGGVVQIAANTRLYVVPGVYPWMFRATSGGELYAAKAGIAVIFAPNVHYSRAFVVSEHSGVCHVKVLEYTGEPKGKRYIARFNGGIVTKSAGRGIMPGSEAGLACHGGYYF